MADNDIKITPIEHAIALVNWDNKIFLTDPVGDLSLFEDQPETDIILLTDIHGDHLNVETLRAVVAQKTTLVAPQAVADELPEDLKQNLTVLANGESTEIEGFNILATPMYNVPESEESYHVKGRGNGYVIEHQDKRVYFSGDSGNTPEMRALKNIDIAFVAMNLPYTMSVEDAANAVLAFKPKQVYPYHYRTPEGYSDVEKFKQLVNAGNRDIEVKLKEWYPNK